MISLRHRRFAHVLALTFLLIGCDPGRSHRDASIEGPARPETEVAKRETSRRETGQALGGPAEEEKVVLFGDLHVHTTHSFDAYLFSLPLMSGEGAHPPNDACDFARYCADLDFYALTDHAESMLPDNWMSSKESVRQCNEVAGDPNDPDVVAFMGFEWSQAGNTPEDHWGHRCVFFKDTGEDQLPTRPIGARADNGLVASVRDNVGFMRMITPWHWQAYTDYMNYATATIELPHCKEGVPVRDNPASCYEYALTPAGLREKLDDWDHEAIVIPHGTAWGVYTPATTKIDKHLDPAQFDAERQVLMEIMSGHGNSEEYRSWREWAVDESGNRVCPEPTEEYLPCCWQAGEIMRSRCGDLPADECERRVKQARQFATEAYVRPQQVFPDAPLEAWLDCDQCRDCFKPSFSYRPLESVQYAMTLNRDDAKGADGKPLRFRYGFIGSSDGHSSRPGTGYKAVERGMMTDATGDPSAIAMLAQKYMNRMEDPQQPARPITEGIRISGNDLRVGNFLYPGGIAAVHSSGRSRDEIWDAMQRREVYGTSGPRILLWFDLLDGEQRLPMGSQVARSDVPRFQVRAAGAPIQKPGCPEWVAGGLSPERTKRLCRNECNNPSDERHPIAAIEIIRIRTRNAPGERLEQLIEDPWKRFECPPDPAGCAVEFDDPEFTTDGRDTLYYARAVQVETNEINGAQLRTQFDDKGRAVSIEWCPPSDECLAPSQERAWSSPIFVDYAAAASAPEPPLTEGQ